MSHAFDLTPEQLEALAKPWEAGNKLHGLRVLKDAATTGRPVSKRYYEPRESTGVDCLVVFQVLESGHHRAVIFSTTGAHVADHQNTQRSTVERWVLNQTEPRVSASLGDPEGAE